MSTINVDVINPYFIAGNVTLNGTPVRNNPSANIIGIGSNAALNATGVGSNTVAIGKDALQTVTSGDANTAVGNAALSLCTGSNNTAIGRNAGNSATTGGNNIFIGHAVSGSTVTASNEITLGNSSNSVLRCAVTTITSLSDARDKKSVKTLPVGLDFVNALKPVKFVWNERAEGGRKNIKDFGFIAQDLKQTQEESGEAESLKLVYEENPERLEASYGKLIPILVKAVQELSAKVAALESAK